MQEGIVLGLNGMAVGGRRRITIDRSLICTHLPQDADPRAVCDLIAPDQHGRHRGPDVRKETLTVEATLTESCKPILFRAISMNGNYLIKKLTDCKSADQPRLDSSAPV
jgi:hypothetical protein